MLADLGVARLGVDLDGAQVRAVREREGRRVDGRVGLQRRLHAVGQVVRGERLERDLLDRLRRAGGSALDAEGAVLELEVPRVGLEHVRRDQSRLVHHALGGLEDGHAADHERA
jgi:hypothetical protein